MLIRTPFQTTEVHLARMVMPALALEVVAVHRPLLHLLVFAEGAGLLQQPVDQGRLAVVDVRDDRDVAQFHGRSLGREFWARCKHCTG